MKAGCELDALVAEKVMGAYWTERENVCRILWNADGVEMVMEEWYEKDWVPSTAPLPEYSTRIQDAWLVVEKMASEHSYGVEKDNVPLPLDKPKYECYFVHDAEDSIYRARADTAPLAICLAALKAVEVT